MSNKRLSEINYGDEPGPIEVRVVRKWIPFSKRQEKRPELCYLFVDIHGDAIEAIADLPEEAYFDTLIQLQTCYTIDRYVSIHSRTYMAVVPHKASLKIGKWETFVPLTGKNIPTYYYNFATYEDLDDRRKSPALLTDYIGRVESITPILERAGKKLRKITIQDESQHQIEITLWRDKAYELEREEAAIGAALAITSTMVTEFREDLQLESTSSTHLFQIFTYIQTSSKI